MKAQKMLLFFYVFAMSALFLYDECHEYMLEDRFLDASTHLYKRVRPFVSPSVRRSIHNPLMKNAITARKLKETSGKHQGNIRETSGNS